jgi:hypothetical protein
VSAGTTFTVTEFATLADGSRALCRVTYFLPAGFGERRAVKIEVLP